MFLIIPLILIVFSAAGIGKILWPKIKEIKNSDAPLEIKEKIWRLALPEFFNAWDKIDFQGFKRSVFIDYEKFLRRIKILSLKTDNFINRLLEKKQQKPPKPDLSDFKTRENRLIAEIAKNPKNKNLYKALGVLYAKNNRFGEASEVFNMVLKLDPNDLEAKESLEE